MEFPPLVRHRPCIDFQTTCSRDLLFFKQLKCCRLRGSRYRIVEGRSLFSHERIDKRVVHSSMLKADSPSMESSFESQKKLDDFHLKDVNWPSPKDEIPFWKKEFPPFDSDLHSTVNESKDSDLLHVIHVTAEMAPIAKVGGLGDVVTGLSRACLLRGHTVNIMLPFYQCIPRNQINCLELVRQYKSFFNDSWVETNAYCGKVSGIPVTLIEPSNQFFKGQSVYGGSYNELEAYLFFSRACLEYLQVSGIQPDIIHVHEWQMGAIPLLYWDMYHQLAIQKPRLVLTIHNMEHYGECRQEQLSLCGLDAPVYAVEEKAVDDRTIGHNPERLSLLKGGIVYSNAVVFPNLSKGNFVLWLVSKHSHASSGKVLRHRERC